MCKNTDPLLNLVYRYSERHIPAPMFGLKPNPYNITRFRLIKSNLSLEILTRGFQKNMLMKKRFHPSNVHILIDFARILLITGWEKDSSRWNTDCYIMRTLVFSDLFYLSVFERTEQKGVCAISFGTLSGGKQSQTSRFPIGLGPTPPVNIFWYRSANE